MTTATVDSWFGTIRITPHPDLKPLRPQKKVRGRRRYYRALRRDAERFAVNPSGWYDFMHWHVDWSGLGNVSWKERREHLAALFIMFRRLLFEVSTWSTRHQVWLQIDPYDSSQDAIYLHTPNPNADNFPKRFVGIQWDVTPPERLREFVADQMWQFGVLNEKWTQFFVRPRPTE